MKLINKSMLTAIITLSTASVYYAQQVQDTVKDTRSKDIEQVVLTGVADIAKDRKTPVAVSTIKEAQIIERLGNQEFPEILNTTPSVYVTKGGGGFGDGTIRIRGFENANIAVMINGVPVNDMEGGTVYWSNWAGLSDVTSAMQVQRGLGASKLAIASVGGTINILTRSSDKKQGGNVTVGVGNDGYYKASFAYNTGKSAKGWSTSFLLSRTAGSMYFDGSQFEGYNYYFAQGYQTKNGKHDFQFTMTGAPQWHNQNFANTIATDIKYGNGVDEPNRRYNSNWGYLNGKEFSQTTNYYSKPVISFNWDWKISEKSKLSTVGYASFGRGGGTGILGAIPVKNGTTTTSTGINALPKTADGLLQWDEIVKWNQGQPNAFGTIRTNPNGNLVNNSSLGIIQRANVNSHDWYGLLSTFNHKFNDSFNFSVGIDTRYYYGYHPAVATNFLGANGYFEKGNLNMQPGYLINQTSSATPSANPFVKAIKDDSQILGRNYNGEVLWYGGFGQLEYSTEKLSAFVSGALSNQSYQRIDNWVIDGVTKQNDQIVNTKTGMKDLIGYNVKGGLNYNLDSNNNFFGNIGYISKQPFLTAVYPNNKQTLNPNLTNEKIFSVELGYGLRLGKLRANVNVYSTNWKDRFQRKTGLTVTNSDNIQVLNAYAEISGLQEIHKGIEFDATYTVNKFLDLDAAASLGNYKYKGNAAGSVYDDNNVPVNLKAGSNSTVLALDNVKVGNSAQKNVSLGATVKPLEGLRIFANWRWYGDLYSNFSINDFDSSLVTSTYTPGAIEKGALKLPDYNLLDLGANYTLNISKKNSLTFGFNVYNVLDTTYISEGTSNILSGLTQKNFSTAAAYQAYLATPEYKGIKQSNNVYFGFGRTWSGTVSFKF
ncbi:TonB-dependent receptor [Chryseobacterium ginsenosidimutans]|uniref:TonB-dependent receptor n=1 Tax=Chryseobacterium ginsenosidimutans TaxID=687846 RepID=UPI002169CF9B|nr:TonB-dependent receptor [Chryseobacterium ginsenosidimutans]